MSSAPPLLTPASVTASYKALFHNQVIHYQEQCYLCIPPDERVPQTPVTAEKLNSPFLNNYAVVNDIMYIFDNDILLAFNLREKTNPEKKNLIKKTGLKYPRYELGIAVIRNKFIMAIGGSNYDRISQNRIYGTPFVEIYNTDTNKWAWLPKLSEGVALPSIMTFNHQYVYRIGGYTIARDPTYYSEAVEKLNLADTEGGWEGLPNFSGTKARYGLSGFQVNDDQMLFFGIENMMYLWSHMADKE